MTQQTVAFGAAATQTWVGRRPSVSPLCFSQPFFVHPWVWSPHVASEGYETYWPGDDYVDWVATGALNYGTVDTVRRGLSGMGLRAADGEGG